VWHDSFICVTWLIHMCDDIWYGPTVYSSVYVLCDKTYLFEQSDSFICVTWLIHMCNTCDLSWFGPTVYMMWTLCLTRLMCVRKATHSYVWHDLFMYVTCVTWYDSDLLYTTLCMSCVTWLMCVRNATHSYVWHDLFMCVTCVTWYDSDLLYISSWTTTRVTRRMHDLCVTHNSFLCVTWLPHMTRVYSTTRSWLLLHDSWLLPHDSGVKHNLIHMCDVTPPQAYLCDMNILYITSLTTCVTSLIHDLFVCVTWMIHMCDMNHLVYIIVYYGLPRSVGSIKL